MFRKNNPSQEQLLCESIYPVVKAGKEGNLEEIKKYIEKGHDVNSTFDSYRRYTLLHYASQYGQKHIVEYLLNCKDIDLLAVDEDGATPLHIAALYSHPEIVKILCEHPNNNGINSKTPYGYTPLHMAIDTTNDPVIIKRSHAVIDFLLSMPQTDVLISTRNKETPLTQAKQCRRFDVMEKLINAATIQLGVYLTAIDPKGSKCNSQKLLIFFKNREWNMTHELYNEIILPQMKHVFDNNPDSIYELVAHTQYCKFLKYGVYLKRKDDKDIKPAIDMLILLAKNTHIKLKEFCWMNDFPLDHIHLYKSSHLKSAYLAFVAPILFSIYRQVHLLPINNMDIWFKIFSYCNEAINSEKKVLLAYNSILNSFVNANDGQSLAQYYSAMGGSFAKRTELTLFSRTSQDKINTLNKWSIENPGGAAEKTLKHYFLK